MRLRAGLVVVLMVLVGCSAPGRVVRREVPSSLAASYLYTEGVKAELMGDLGRARAIFEDVVEIDSMHGAAYFELAGLLAAGEPQKAIDYARKATVIENANTWYSMLYGRLMVFSGRYAEALDVYADLVRRAPHQPEIHRMLAALYQQQGELYSAIATLRQAEQLLGPQEAFSESLGKLYLQVGQDSLALDALQGALALNPENGEVLLALCSYYRSHRLMDDFFAVMRRVITSTQVDLHTKHLMVDELRNDLPFYQAHFYAVRDLVVALWMQCPDDWEAIDRYGMTLAAANGVEPALDFFKTQLAADSVPVTIYRRILEMEAYLDRSDSLAHYARLALAHYPDDVDLYVRLGGAYAYMNRSLQAHETLRQALRHAATDSVRSVIWGVMGDLYHADGNATQCYKHYERALKADSTNAMVLNNFAYYISVDSTRAVLLPRAIDMASRAVALTPGNATYLDTYAWALFRAARLPEAKKIMQQAVSLDTEGNETLYDHYGDILHALGENFMARIYYQKALDKNPGNSSIAQKISLLD